MRIYDFQKKNRQETRPEYKKPRSVKYQPDRWPNWNFVNRLIWSIPITGKNFKSKSFLVLEIWRGWNVYFPDQNQKVFLKIINSHKNWHFDKVWRILAHSICWYCQIGNFDPGLQNTRPWQVAQKFPQTFN